MPDLKVSSSLWLISTTRTNLDDWHIFLKCPFPTSITCFIWGRAQLSLKLMLFTTKVTCISHRGGVLSAWWSLLFCSVLVFPLLSFLLDFLCFIAFIGSLAFVLSLEVIPVMSLILYLIALLVLSVSIVASKFRSSVWSRFSLNLPSLCHLPTCPWLNYRRFH